jgi:microcin C transport system substrate-binding protein
VIKAELPDGTMAPGQSFVMNLRKPQLQDIRVREAISLMFNFEWSNDTLFYGLYQRIHSLWENSYLAAEGLPGDDELAILEPLAELLPPGVLTEPAVMAAESGARQLDRGNLRRASALLDEAGWQVGDDGMRRNAAGQTLKIEFLEESPSFDRVVNPFVENLRRLGVDAVYSRVDSAQYTARVRDKDFDIITDQLSMSYEPGTGLLQYFGSTQAADSVFNTAGVAHPAVDALIETVMAAATKDEMITAVKALDRTLRALRFWVPQWYVATHRVAYFNMYEYPDPLPPYDLGYLDFWWYNAEKAAALKAAGALR